MECSKGITTLAGYARYVPECVHVVEQRDCGDCRDRAHAKPPPDPSLFGVVFECAARTFCTSCGQRIEDGDSIRSDGRRGWICMACSDAAISRWRGTGGYDQSLVRLYAAGRIDTGRGTG